MRRFENKLADLMRECFHRESVATSHGNENERRFFLRLQSALTEFSQRLSVDATVEKLLQQASHSWLAVELIDGKWDVAYYELEEDDAEHGFGDTFRAAVDAVVSKLESP